MSQLTPHLGLKKPDGTDPFLRQDFDDNYDLLDTVPGMFICTSTTHPTTWGDNQVGRAIIEVDTGNILYFRADHTFQPGLTQDGRVPALQSSVSTLTSQVSALQSALALTPTHNLYQRSTDSTLNNGATLTFDIFGGTVPQMFFSAAGRILLWGFVGINAPGRVDTENLITIGITVDGTASDWGDQPTYGHETLSAATAGGHWNTEIPFITYRDIGSAGGHNMQISVTNHDSVSAVTVTHIKTVCILVH